MGIASLHPSYALTHRHGIFRFFPIGKITPRCVALLSTPSAKNISLPGLVDTALVIPAVPPRHEGRFAIVTDVECGMRWTFFAHQTNAHETDGEALLAKTGDADGEVVWARYPDADIKLAMMLCITPATETTKPGLRGEREGNR